MAEKTVKYTDHLVAGDEPDDLYELAVFTFDDEEAAKRFLNRKHPMLGGITPLEAAKTKEGLEGVQKILHGLLYGFPA